MKTSFTSELIYDPTLFPRVVELSKKRRFMLLIEIKPDYLVLVKKILYKIPVDLDNERLEFKVRLFFDKLVDYPCYICMERSDVVSNCLHFSCIKCGSKMRLCGMCRTPITSLQWQEASTNVLEPNIGHLEDVERSAISGRRVELIWVFVEVPPRVQYAPRGAFYLDRFEKLKRSLVLISFPDIYESHIVSAIDAVWRFLYLRERDLDGGIWSLIFRFFRIESDVNWWNATIMADFSGGTVPMYKGVIDIEPGEDGGSTFRILSDCYFGGYNSDMEPDTDDSDYVEEEDEYQRDRMYTL